MTDKTFEATITTTSATTRDALATWSPTSGEATAQLLARQDLSDEARASIRGQAIQILARCGDPREPGERRAAHLVVGEVQSGKTLSFTTAIALARDNDFPLVVVLAGTKINLVQQTVSRFRRDLLDIDGRPPQFQQFQVGAEQHNPVDLTRALRAAADPRVPKEFRPTVVIFALKHTARLEALADELRDSIAAVGDVPTLIIDDEADQAGMNVGRPGRESPVYGAIGALRRAIPRNDMLMYTATPQAPLLMEVADELAPDTVAVLKSGAGYVGGRQLFIDGFDGFVRIISDADLSIALDISAIDPPTSLRVAILNYLVALTQTHKVGKVRPLSMLIHPAYQRDLHDKYQAWTRAIVDGVHATLEDPDDVSFDELKDELVPICVEFAASADEQPLDVDELLEMMRYLIPLVQIKVVNSGNPDEIAPEDWGRQVGWILIGGNKLDRGFTIENLAVTYMPRGRGIGAADSIQQRGRFFGYKAKYVGYLRGWFNAEVADAFHSYVAHEQSLIEGLTEVENSATPLRQWKRKFLLDRKYRPTRTAAFRLPVASWRPLRRDGWFVQRQPFAQDIIEANRETFQKFVTLAGQLEPEPLDLRGDHQAATVPAAEALALLAEWRSIGGDSQRLTALELGLAADPQLTKIANARLVFMDGDIALEPHDGRRTRTLGSGGDTPLMQGPTRSRSYLGDVAIFEPAAITIQLHLLTVLDDLGKVLADPVAAIAVHVADAPVAYIEG